MDIVLLALVAFVVIILVRGIKVIRQAETVIIERLGRYHRTLESGINVIVPIIDTPRPIEWRFIKNDQAGRPMARKSRCHSDWKSSSARDSESAPAMSSRMVRRPSIRWTRARSAGARGSRQS